MTLTVEEALRAYAAMMNTLDVSRLEPYLAEDFIYESQAVLEPIVSRTAFLEYMQGKLEALARPENAHWKVWAEMGYLEHSWPGPCAIVAQGGADDLEALVLATVEGDKIKRIDLCIAPAPHSAVRSGDYPQ